MLALTVPKCQSRLTTKLVTTKLDHETLDKIGDVPRLLLLAPLNPAYSAFGHRDVKGSR